MDQIINLDRQDDILKVRSQVEWSDGRRIILVVPRDARALDSEYELRLLHRWADESDVQVALISDDINLRERATAEGIPIYTSVGRAQSTRWKWKRNGRDGVTRDTALDPTEPGPRPALLNQLGLAGVQLAFTLVFFSVAIFFLAIAALIVVPSARITIQPAAMTVNDSREVILDPGVNTVDQINNTLPATTFRKDISGTATIATTKVDTAAADQATGEVIFTNLAGTPATIPSGTIVETSSGVTVRFATAAPADLPAGYNARVTVPVKALDPGPNGNVKALQINVIEGPLSSVARVINTQPIGGGSMKQVHMVSFDDKARLRDLLNSELRTAAIARIQQLAGDSTVVMPASVQISVITESFDHLVDDPSDTLSLHVEAVATGMAVQRSDLEQFAQAILGGKLPKGYSILPGTLQVQPDSEARVEGNAVIFTLRSSYQITPKVNQGDVLKGLTGKTPDEAATILSRRIQLAQPPKIEVSPSWWPRLPWWGLRLALFVNANAPPQAGAESGQSQQ